MTTTWRQPAWRVTLDGADVTPVLGLQLSHGYDLAVAEATVRVPALPNWAVAGASRLVVAAGASAGTAVRFDGVLAGTNDTAYPGEIALVGKGNLSLAQLDENATPLGTDMTNGLAGATDQAIVTAVLTTVYSGGAISPALSIGGTGVLLGTQTLPSSSGVSPFDWAENEAALSYIQRIDQISVPGDGSLGAYRTFDGPSGAIYRVAISSTPAGPAFYTFTEADMESGSATLQVDTTGVRNRSLVQGVSGPNGIPAEQTVTQTSPWLPAGVTATDTFSSNLIEKQNAADPGDGIACDTVARYRLSEVNRLAQTLTFTTPRDDGIVPGVNIAVTSARLGLSSTLFFVARVDLSLDPQAGFGQRLTCLGGPASTLGVNFPLLADFTMTVEQERVIVGGAAQTLYVLGCQAAGVVPAGTPDSAYAWTVTGTSPTPASGTGPSFNTSLASLTAASVELAVTVAGDTGTITKAVGDPATGGQVVTRRLFLAGSDMEDFDGTTWRTNAVASAAVANAPAWADGTSVAGSTNDLATAPTVTAPSIGSVNDLWVETDVAASTILAGGSSGSLALSTDGGTTWVVAPAKPDGTAILRCVLSRQTAGQWFALTAGGLYRTDNAGAGWVAVQLALAGETFRDVSVSHTRIMVAMAGGRVAIDSAGVSQVFPVLSPVVSDVVAVTADIQQDRFWYVDSTGRTFYTGTGSNTVVGQTTSLPAGCVAQPRGLWRDGGIRGLLYLAGGGGGAWKSVDGFGSAGGYYQLRSPGVDGSPAGASYARIGADGRYVTAAQAAAPVGAGPYAASSFGNISSTLNSGNWPKAFSLWNGSGNNAEPAGWYTTSFDESAWPAAMVATNADGGDPFWTGGFQPDVWYPENVGAGQSNPASGTELCLFRLTLTLPSGSFRTVTLKTRECGKVYLNGQLVADATSYAAADHSFSLPLATILPGRRNVIAWQGPQQATSNWRFTNLELDLA